MGGYVNIKTFTHSAGEGKEVKGVEQSVAFTVYSDAHEVAGSHYQTFPSEVAAYTTVHEDTEAGRTSWATANKAMFTPTDVAGG